MPTPTLARHPSRRPRRALRETRHGQSMVEFALVAPLFLALMFGVMEGGMLLYGYNSAQHASQLGSEVIAAEGSTVTADSDALTTIGKTDFGQSGLVTITQVNIYKLASDGSNTRDTMSCGGTGCWQSYLRNGTLITGNWPPTARNTSSASADYVELDIAYDYHYFFTKTTVLHLTNQRFFRLEPQS